MERQILVPLDGSSLAEAAIPHAVVLARATDSTLHLVRTIQPVSGMSVVTWPVPAPTQFERWMADSRREAQQYLAPIAAHLRTAGLAVETTVINGNPVESILTMVTTEPTIREIVMASHGRHGLERWLFGSVAEKVVQTLAAPVLVVPVHQREEREEVEQSAQSHPVIDLDHTYATILVALDGSTFAEQALEPARQLAERCAASLVLLSIVPVLSDLSFGADGMVPLWTGSDQQRVRVAVTEYLEVLAQRVATDRVAVRTRVVDGLPATLIAATAIEERADLIAMATHGRSGLSRLWLGSVATRVLQNTNLPVLLIPAVEAGV